jgi:hypothetical protein
VAKQTQVEKAEKLLFTGRNDSQRKIKSDLKQNEG